ncbi:MAG: hypothetical protein LBV27_07000 [Oscillospiraceae bacterium]|nr:hypothetical protein [Oscillospiraceae bacterium]
MLMRLISFVAATAGVIVIFMCSLAVFAVELDIRCFNGAYSRTVYGALEDTEAVYSAESAVSPHAYSDYSYETDVWYDDDEHWVAYENGWHSSDDYDSSWDDEWDKGAYDVWRETMDDLRDTARETRQDVKEALKDVRDELSRLKPVIREHIQDGADVIISTFRFWR